jgi:splicing factor 3B subunit 5
MFVVSEANIFIVYSEWVVNIQRDSYASYVGHISALLAYFAIAENESIGRERYNFMQVC